MKALLILAAGLAFAQPRTPYPYLDLNRISYLSRFRWSMGQARQPVAGLTRDDFVIFDEGEAKDIVAFDDGSGPRDVALLLDVSGGFTNEGVFYSASAFLELQREEDRVALVSFSDGSARLRTSLTRDASEIRRGCMKFFQTLG